MTNNEYLMKKLELQEAATVTLAAVLAKTYPELEGIINTMMDSWNEQVILLDEQHAACGNKSLTPVENT